MLHLGSAGSGKIPWHHLQDLCVLWALLIWLSVTADDVKWSLEMSFSQISALLFPYSILFWSASKEMRMGWVFILIWTKTPRRKQIVFQRNSMVGNQIGIVRHRCLQRDSCRDFWPLMAIARPYLSPTEPHISSDFAFVIISPITFLPFFLVLVLGEKSQLPTSGTSFPCLLTLYVSSQLLSLWGRNTFEMLIG